VPSPFPLTARLDERPPLPRLSRSPEAYQRLGFGIVVGLTVLDLNQGMPFASLLCVLPRPVIYPIWIMRSFRPLSPEDAHWFCQHVLKDLAVFSYAVDSGNRSDSAEKLGLSPQRVGQTLRDIERNLEEFLNGGKLIKWHKKIEVAPTEAGIIVSEFAQDMLKRSEVFLDKLYRVQYGNDVRVACIHSGWMAYGAQLEAMFKKRVPDGTINVDIIGGLKYPEKIHAAVAQGHADIGITSYPPPIDPSLTLQPLKDRELRLVLNPAYPRRPKQPKVNVVDFIRDDVNIKLALHTRAIASPMSTKVTSYLRKCGADFWPHQRLEGQNIAEIVDTIQRIPNVISILPTDAINREVKTGQLLAYSIDPPMKPWVWAVIYHTGTSRPAVRHFLDCLRPLFKHSHKTLEPS
jgi:DNA-binding transcriptional LysR family regulator